MFELFQKMSDPPADRCATCGASPVEKVLFPVAVHFKGSGFYSTDYGRGARKGGKDGEKGDAPTATSGSGEANGAKTDTPSTSSDTSAPASSA